MESDSRSENGDGNLDTTHDLRTLDGGQPGNKTLEILSAPFDRSADKPEDGDNDEHSNNTDGSIFLCSAKRQRSASLRSESNLRLTNTPSLSHDQDGKGRYKISMAAILKIRKRMISRQLSASQCDETALNSQYGQSGFRGFSFGDFGGWRM